MSCRTLAPTPLALLLLLLAAGSAAAQRQLPLGMDGPTLRLEVTRPLFGVGPFREAHLATSVWSADLVVPVEGWPTLFAQLGFGVGELGGAWSGALANPRVGALFGRPDGLSASIHAGFPLARGMGDGFAGLVGRYAHFEDWDRFGGRSWALGASGTARSEIEAGSFLGARLGSTLLIPTEHGLDPEAFVTLTVFGEVPAGRARLWIELSGIGVLTEPERSLVEVTSSFATFSVSLPVARLAPEAYIRVPLDEDVSGVVSFILGARIHIGHTRRGA